MLANASACADQRIRMRYITYTVEFLRMQNRPENRLLELFWNFFVRKDVKNVQQNLQIRK